MSSGLITPRCGVCAGCAALQLHGRVDKRLPSWLRCVLQDAEQDATQHAVAAAWASLCISLFARRRSDRLCELYSRLSLSFPSLIRPIEAAYERRPTFRESLAKLFASRARLRLADIRIDIRMGIRMGIRTGPSTVAGGSTTATAATARSALPPSSLSMRI